MIEIYVHGFLNFGETQAEKYFTELEDCFEVLGNAPLMCRERTEFTPPVRIHHRRRHLVIYVMQDDRILIIRVLHDSIDVKQHLLPL